MHEPTGRHSAAFQIRFPMGLRELIKSSAQKNRRSMNAEIICALEEKFSTPEITAGGEFGDTTPAATQKETALQRGPKNKSEERLIGHE